MYVTDTGRASGHGPRGTGEGVPRPTSHPSEPESSDVIRSLDHSPRAAGAARRMVQESLDRLRVGDEDVDRIVLAVSELVTNAVEHALPPLALHLRRDARGQEVWVGVSDGGPAPHGGPWTTSCADEEHGRGLGIVEALTDGQGTFIRPDGKATHWVLFATAP